MHRSRDGAQVVRAALFYKTKDKTCERKKKTSRAGGNTPDAPTLTMLQADKQVLLAGVKRNALELRQRELEFHVERYTNLATQASVVAGFSFESLVELEIPEGTNPILSSCYFVCGSLAMALALYVLCVASFACVFGHRLALQGPHLSLIHI